MAIKSKLPAEAKIEVPNENPDIGKEGFQSKYNDRYYPSIPVGIAGVWHSHKKQGIQASDANVQVPGATYAMIVPNLQIDFNRDDPLVSVLIRTDIRDASGQATSTVSVLMTPDQAMNFLNENFVQTRFRG